MQKAAKPSPRFAHPAKNVAELEVDEGMFVADFGAGSGHYVIACAYAVRPSGRVFAIDVPRALLRRIKHEAIARGIGDTIEIITGDIERAHGTMLADKSVDLVLASNVFFQLADISGALHEAHRILKPKGRLAVIEWSDSLPAGARRMGPAHRDVLTREKILALARAEEYEAVRGFPAGGHHWGVIFRPVPHDEL